MPSIILIHGIGDHADSSFKTSFTNIFNYLHKEFYKNVPNLNEHCNVELINYDTIFDKILEKQRKSTQQGSITASDNKIFQSLLSYGETIREDNFFTKSALDAFIYNTFLARAVEAEAGEQFYKAYNSTVKNGNVDDCHVICHSLGTAVMHNLLHRLFDTMNKQENTPKYLSYPYNKIKSLTMLANVSRVFPHARDPYSSRVKPDLSNGMCKYFRNVYHEFDLVALFRKFNPTAIWDNDTLFNYVEIRFNEVVDLHRMAPDVFSEERQLWNIHSFEHYLACPDVHVGIMNDIFRKSEDRPKKNEIDKYTKHWHKLSLMGIWEELKQTKDSADFSDGIDDEAEKLKDIYSNFARFFNSDTTE
ncbi:hypothetical protein [Alteromonas ponticola]|uniref:Alpha/beta hydrolase n=1 Tax=Alteromonas ponticola TaxID=2720613 RepID=A0ABX1QZQ7_9ALTE|nr:hypothetical protein [Alteromonas ponticola]NMH59156.1 hypothetical protein [Alteromonas ponticola]